MATDKKKTANELVKSYPGAYQRRKELIGLLSRAGVPSRYDDPDNAAQWIIRTANKILEEEWN